MFSSPSSPSFMEAQRHSKFVCPYAQRHRHLKTMDFKFPKGLDRAGGCQCCGSGYFSNISFFFCKVDFSSGLRLSEISRVEVKGVDIAIGIFFVNCVEEERNVMGGRQSKKYSCVTEAGRLINARAQKK